MIDNNIGQSKIVTSSSLKIKNVAVVLNKNSSRGLGDTIAKITSAVGITSCGGCKKRQQKLNKLFPYKGES